MVDLAKAIVDLGIRHDDYSTEKYKKINAQIEALQRQMQGTLSPLKTQLSGIIGRSPDAQHFDISEHWDLILDFQELYNDIQKELGKEATPLFGKDEFEKSKKVSKEDLDQLIKQVENVLDDKKFDAQKQTQDLFTHSNLALTLYDCLNKTLRSYSQGQERLSQATRTH